MESDATPFPQEEHADVGGPPRPPYRRTGQARVVPPARSGARADRGRTTAGGAAQARLPGPRPPPAARLRAAVLRPGRVRRLGGAHGTGPPDAVPHRVA